MAAARSSAKKKRIQQQSSSSIREQQQQQQLQLLEQQLPSSHEEQRMDEVLSTLLAMRRQEATHYQVTTTTAFFPVKDGIKKKQPQQKDADMSESFRGYMVSWCFLVVDHFKFHREMVEITMKNLDRFVATSEGGSTALRDRQSYQLAALVCLYQAVKLHDPKAYKFKSVETLLDLWHRWQTTMCTQEFCRMQLQLNMALNWRLHPPTALQFIRHYWHVLPQALLQDDARQRAVYQLSKYQTELAVIEFNDTIKASTIGYCALWNALESTLGGRVKQSHQHFSAGWLLEECLEMLSVSIGTMFCLAFDEVALIRGQLFEAVLQHQPKQPQQQQPQQQQPSILLGLLTKRGNNNKQQQQHDNKYQTVKVGKLTVAVPKNSTKLAMRNSATASSSSSAGGGGSSSQSMLSFNSSSTGDQSPGAPRRRRRRKPSSAVVVPVPSAP